MANRALSTPSRAKSYSWPTPRNAPQYESLQTLYQRFKDRGFEILAFPANDFGRQEPGNNEEIDRSS